MPELPSPGRQKQRTRYNHPNLVPFVLETNGRWGPTAETFIHKLAPTDPESRRIAISTIRHSLAIALQRYNADMISRAYGLG